jgi:hypothetical protein
MITPHFWFTLGLEAHMGTPPTLPSLIRTDALGTLPVRNLNKVGTAYPISEHADRRSFAIIFLCMTMV